MKNKNENTLSVSWPTNTVENKIKNEIICETLTNRYIRQSTFIGVKIICNCKTKLFFENGDFSPQKK